MAVNLSAYLTLKAKGFNQGMEKADAKVKKFSAGMGKLRGLMGSAMALGGLVTVFKSLAEAADDIDNLSTQMGIGYEKTQKFQIAADNTGESISVVADAFKTLTIQTQRALGGEEKLKAGFIALGISIEMMKRANAEEMFDQLNVALTTSKNRAEAVALAMVLIGEPVYRLAPILDEFNTIQERVTSPEAIAALDRWEAAWSKSMRSIKVDTMEASGGLLMLGEQYESTFGIPQKIADLYGTPKGVGAAFTEFFKPGTGVGGVKLGPISEKYLNWRTYSKLFKEIGASYKRMSDEQKVQSLKDLAAEALKATQLDSKRKKSQADLLKEQKSYAAILKTNMLQRLNDEEKLKFLLMEQKQLIKDANTLKGQGNFIGMFQKLTAAAKSQSVIAGLGTAATEKTKSPLGGFGVTQSGMQQAGARMGGVDHRLNLLNQKQVDIQQRIYDFMQRAVDNFQGRPKERSPFGD